MPDHLYVGFSGESPVSREFGLIRLHAEATSATGWLADVVFSFLPRVSLMPRLTGKYVSIRAHLFLITLALDDEKENTFPGDRFLSHIAVKFVRLMRKNRD